MRLPGFGAPPVLASPASEGACRHRRPWLRVTVPGHRQVSQCIFFTAASADHEAELLEVRDTVEVNESAGHHEDVEELMGVELEQGGV